MALFKSIVLNQIHKKTTAFWGRGFFIKSSV